MMRRALVIGINRYPFLSQKEGRCLATPAGDAEKIARLLDEAPSELSWDVWRMPESFTREGKPQVEEKQIPVSQAKLSYAIHELLYGEPVPEVALLFFAGHGIRRAGGGFLAASDTRVDAQTEDREGISFSWLRDELLYSPVKKQIVWLDCCHSGDLLSFTEAELEEWHLRGDRSLIAACQGDRVAYAASAGGVLTQELVNALNPQLHPEEDEINTGTVTDLIEKRQKKEPLLKRQIPICKNFGERIRLWEGKGFNIEKKPIERIKETLESYLIVTVKPDDKLDAQPDDKHTVKPDDNSKEFFLKAWLIEDNSRLTNNFEFTNDYLSAFKYLLDDENERPQGILCEFNQIPEEFKKFVSKALKELRGKTCDLTIEVFLPNKLICTAVDRWQIFDNETTLGAEYPVRLRSLERLDWEKYLDRNFSKWSQQWNQVISILDKQPTSTFFQHFQKREMDQLNGKQLKNCLVQSGKVGLKLTCSPPENKIEDLFKAISYAAPIAIWTRCNVVNCTQCDTLNCTQVEAIDQILNSQPLRYLPQSVQKLRADADAQENDQHLGCHLALLWEYPYRLPPDVIMAKIEHDKNKEFTLKL
ncbi:MAG TPA: hypothetical protein DDZ60_10915 [Planktothrix sp. UBA10369]|jgi:Uncharacterized protein containing caspase domain|nr:hypothetical protein [Planktothrix sp. UBA10369]